VLGARVLLELFGGTVAVLVALAKLTEVDVYPAGDYRASLAYKLVVAVVGLAVGLTLLAHATILELRRRRRG
jgi:hypothetical protein